MTERELIASMAATILAARKQGAEDAVKDALRIIMYIDNNVPQVEDGEVNWWKVPTAVGVV